MKAGPVRPSPIAGSWYPGDARAIRAEVERYLADVPATRAAGPADRPDRAARRASLLGAGGRARLRARSAAAPAWSRCSWGRRTAPPLTASPLYDRGAFETPLGRAVIDEAVAARLLEGGGVVVADERPHRLEHSLEMQLPFLQHLVPDLRIVPLLMGSQVREEVDALAAALARVAGAPDVLLIASSDLSHYHPAPVANRLDAEVIAEVEALRPGGPHGPARAIPRARLRGRPDGRGDEGLARRGSARRAGPALRGQRGRGRAGQEPRGGIPGGGAAGAP